MTVVPITLKVARAFIACHHRHHPTVTGQKLAIGVLDAAGVLRGVAIVGRCSSRVLDSDPLTAEVTRTCTDGYPNANSALYGACWRIASALGYRRLVTYTEQGESGASLTAAGWVKARPSCAQELGQQFRRAPRSPQRGSSRRRGQSALGASVVMPADVTGDEIGAPQLCPFCVERLARAAEHGHVDAEWAARAAKDFARQCCSATRRTNP